MKDLVSILGRDQQVLSEVEQDLGQALRQQEQVEEHLGEKEAILKSYE